VHAEGDGREVGVSVYRNRYEQCPRCQLALEQSGSVQACSQCAGHWVSADVLREMAEAMQVPPRPVTIELDPHRGPKLPCPKCQVPMETWLLHGVAIDRCDGHGLWFDRTELQAVLYATTGRPIERAHEPIAVEVDSLAEVLTKDKRA